MMSAKQQFIFYVLALAAFALAVFDAALVRARWTRLTQTTLIAVGLALWVSVPMINAWDAM